MRILLDTHVWLWTLVSPDRIGGRARKLVTDPACQLMLSAASAWEIAIKYRLGKLPLPEPPDVFVPPRLVRDGVAPLPVETHHALHVSNLPVHHDDPFDRLLVAQAQLEKLVIVTADRKLAAYDVECVLAL
jgi:PIN domain nuclease of toxin-antitoxin system